MQFASSWIILQQRNNEIVLARSTGDPSLLLLTMQVYEQVKITRKKEDGS